MPRVQVPLVQAVLAGVDEGTQITGDTVNGHYFTPNVGNVLIEAENTGASPYTVTVDPTQVVSGLSLTPLVVTIPATKAYLIGPIPASVFNQPDQSVHFEVSNALIKLRCFKI